MKRTEQQDTRFMRITYNENQWVRPSSHKWFKDKQGDPNTAYERQYGFGYEEWLFNSIYRFESFQYGYLQGAKRLPKGITFINKIYLFTLNNNIINLVAELNNVEILKEQLNFNVLELYRKNLENARQDLILVSADSSSFTDNLPNIRFPWDIAQIYDTPIELTLSTKQYNRFQPYKLTENILENINSNLQKNLKLIFKEGLSDITTEHTKVNNKGISTVKRTHSTIVKDLFNYLKYFYKDNMISAEKSKISGKTPDVLIKHKENTYSIFEVKTNSNALSNIRDAIGQLFEYALSDKDIYVESLIIVGPALMNDDELQFFKRLQLNMKFKIEYWAYNQVNELINKFIITK